MTNNGQSKDHSLLRGNENQSQNWKVEWHCEMNENRRGKALKELESHTIKTNDN